VQRHPAARADVALPFDGLLAVAVRVGIIVLPDSLSVSLIYLSLTTSPWAGNRTRNSTAYAPVVALVYSITFH